MRERKRGQVTVFIIIGVLVVAAVVLFFVLRGGGGGQEQVTRADTQDPGSFLESCMEDDLRSVFRELSRNGGVIGAESTIEFKFEDEDQAREFTYLCHTDSEDTFCDPQYGPVTGRMENEIFDQTSDLSSQCLSSLIDSYEDQGYSVSGGEYNEKEDYLVDLEENRLIVNMNASEMVLSRANETERVETFRFETPSVLYGLGSIANDIVNDESTSGEIDTSSYGFINPGYNVDKNIGLTEGIDWRIYTITEEETGREFEFAVRGQEDDI